MNRLATRLVPRIRRWSAPLFLVAFQVAPVSVQQRSDGHLTVSLGYAAESFLQQTFACDGSLVSEQRYDVKTVSGIVEYARENFRVEAFGGNSRVSVGECRYSSSCVGDMAPLSGSFGGVVISRERQGNAIGGGIAVLPTLAPEYTGGTGTKTRVVPTAHFRIGGKGRAYIRSDYTRIASPGQAPSTTTGVGFWNPHTHMEHAFVGMGVVPRASGSSSVGLAANASIPLGPTRGAITVGAILISGGQTVSAGAKIRVK